MKIRTAVAFFLILIASPTHFSAQTKTAEDQFAEFRRKDWYEDLKRQKLLHERAEFAIAYIESKKPEPRSPEFNQIRKEETAAHLRNYRALSAIAAQILDAKKEDEYLALKNKEDEILGGIGTQDIVDRTHVIELRNISEADADILEISHRYEAIQQ